MHINYVTWYTVDIQLIFFEPLSPSSILSKNLFSNSPTPGLKSLLQYNSSKASVLQCSAFFMVQLSHPYMTAGSDSKAENGYHGRQILFAFSFGLFVLLLILYKLLTLLICEVHVWSAFAWIIVKIYSYFFHTYSK